MSLSDILAACSRDPVVALCIPWPGWLGGPVLAIRWYAVILVASIAVGAAAAIVHAEKAGEDRMAVLDALLYLVPGAVIGARVMYVALDILGGNGSLWLANPLLALNIRSGGLNYFGVLLGGAAALLIWLRRHPYNLLLALDTGALGLWVGQGVGRWVNYVNLELYGPPTGSSWFGMIIPPTHRLVIYSDLARYPLDTRFHPTMLYESLWLLLTFLLTWWLVLRHLRASSAGQFVALYLMVNGIGRFITESWRPDQPDIPGTGITFSRLLALVEIGIGLVIYLRQTGRLHLPRALQPKGGEDLPTNH